MTNALVQSDTEPTWSWRQVSIVMALGLGGFLTNFDVTAVVVAMPVIARDLGFGVAGFAWVMDAYSLAFTGALLAAGALADRYGRRRSLLFGNAIFLLASIACGFAWDGPSLWAARVAQGIGAAFVMTGALALISTAFTDMRQRARVFAALGVVTGVAMALGPSLGGVLTSWFGWRWIFLANIPFCIVIGVAIPFLVGESRDANGRPLDPVGVILFTSALFALVETLLRPGPVGVPHALGGLATLVLAALFWRQQRRRAKPLLDARVFATRPMMGIGALLIAVSVSYWSVLVYLPLFLAAAFQWSMDRAGVALLAATLPMLFVPVLGGRLATAWGWRRLFAVALGAALVGNIVLMGAALAEPAIGGQIAVTLGMALIGVGAALAHPQLTGAVLTLAPATQAGMASAVTIIARQAGFAIGIAALGATLQATQTARAFSGLFALSALIAAIGMSAALLLVPKPEPAARPDKA